MIWDYYYSKYKEIRTFRNEVYHYKNHLSGFYTKAPDEIFTADIVALRKAL